MTHSHKTTLTLWTTALLTASCSTVPSDRETRSLSSNLSSTNLNDRTTAVQSRCENLSAHITPGDVECLTEELIQSSFHELHDAWRGGRISFHSFKSKNYFFKTSFATGHLSRDPAKRTYSIDINDAIYDTSEAPTLEAVQGILAHELVHLVDYENADLAAKFNLAVKIVAHPSSVERATDEAAFKRGFALPIKKYREWIYKRLSPKALKQKQRRYYTPEEIDQWIKLWIEQGITQRLEQHPQN